MPHTGHTPRGSSKGSHEIEYQSAEQQHERKLHESRMKITQKFPEFHK
jgi:hypothetical protein